jgi:DNA-binding NarL/FixJ family response regulator
VIHLMVIDRSRIFAEALAIRFEREPDLVVVAVVVSVPDARQLLSSAICDVAVCDERQAVTLLDPTDGGLRRPRPPHVVVLAERGEWSLATPLVRAGLAGWVSRDQTSSDLLAAIRSVQRGETWIPPDLLTHVLGELTTRDRRERQSADRLSVLTGREREILRLYGEGLGRAQVAARLRLSPNTVRTHVQNILGRLEVHSTLAAVAIARSAPSFGDVDDDAYQRNERAGTAAAPRVRQVAGRTQYRELRLAPDAR